MDPQRAARGRRLNKPWTAAGKTRVSVGIFRGMSMPANTAPAPTARTPVASARDPPPAPRLARSRNRRVRLLGRRPRSACVGGKIVVVGCLSVCERTVVVMVVVGLLFL